MHRRARHLNPKAAGAIQVLDSRFISGLSDGSAVTTWSDRSGKGYDMSQSTAVSKPTYKTAIQGGQPILRFDGGDYMSSSFETCGSHSSLTIFKRTGSATNPFGNATIVWAVGINGNSSASARLFQYAYNDSVLASSLNAGAADMTFTRNDNWNVHSTLAPFGSGTAEYRLNNGTASTASGTPLVSVTSPQSVIGSASWSPGLYFVGDMAVAFIINSAVNSSLMRRLVQNYGYAFKIACS